MGRSLALAVLAGGLAGLVYAQAVTPPPQVHSFSDAIFRLGAFAQAFFVVFLASAVVAVYGTGISKSGAVDAGAAAEQEWRCPKCGEVNGSELEACQSCSEARPDSALPYMPNADQEAAWEALRAANDRLGWYVGPPTHEEGHALPWSLYAYDPREVPKAGLRSHEWTAQADSEEGVVREMARRLREISEGRVPQ